MSALWSGSDAAFSGSGSAPPSNAYLTAEALHQAEVWLPLTLMVCDACWLVQTLDFTGRENLFDADYAYFSSCSSSWLRHAEQFVTTMRAQLALDSQSLVVEVAANDGYLLQYVRRQAFPVWVLSLRTAPPMLREPKAFLC
jgi:hypothetical protein